MLHINDIVVEQGEINIIDGNDNVRSASCGIVHLHIPDLIQQDTRNTFFQNVVNRLLQIGVQRQVDIAPCDRFHSALGIDLSSQIVNVNRLTALFSLQIGFHHALNAGFSHNVVHFIPVLAGTVVRLFIQTCELFRRDFPRISDDMGKIGSVYIAPDGILSNIDTGKRLLVLFDGRHRFLAHIRCDCGRYVFLITVRPHCITDSDKL